MPHRFSEPPPQRRSQARWLGVAALLLIVAIAGWAVWKRGGDPAEVAAAKTPLSAGSVHMALEAPAPAQALAAAAPAPESVAPQAAPVLNPPAQAPGEPLPALSALSDDNDEAWAALGKRWSLQLNGQSACADALKQGHQCFRTIDAGLPVLKALDRPGLAQLRQGGEERWVLLTQWAGDTLTVVQGNRRWALSEAQFTNLWTGRYTTLWRQPMDQTTRLFTARPDEPAGRWLDQQLQKLQAQGEMPATANQFEARVAAFQQKHRLAGDGKALPSTFIKANQLAGVNEPRLSR